VVLWSQSWSRSPVVSSLSSSEKEHLVSKFTGQKWLKYHHIPKVDIVTVVNIIVIVVFVVAVVDNGSEDYDDDYDDDDDNDGLWWTRCLQWRWMVV